MTSDFLLILSDPLICLGLLLFTCTVIIYGIAFEFSPLAATIGKRIFGLRLCGVQGERLEFAEVFMRNITKLTGLILFIATLLACSLISQEFVASKQLLAIFFTIAALITFIDILFLFRGTSRRTLHDYLSDSLTVSHPKVTPALRLLVIVGLITGTTYLYMSLNLPAYPSLRESLTSLPKASKAALTHQPKKFFPYENFSGSVSLSGKQYQLRSIAATLSPNRRVILIGLYDRVLEESYKNRLLKDIRSIKGDDSALARIQLVLNSGGESCEDSKLQSYTLELNSSRFGLGTSESFFSLKRSIQQLNSGEYLNFECRALPGGQVSVEIAMNSAVLVESKRVPLKWNTQLIAEFVKH